MQENEVRTELVIPAPVDDVWRVLVDFNYLYNPDCAYNENWSCPLPPRENHLAVAIRAGEKHSSPTATMRPS